MMTDDKNTAPVIEQAMNNRETENAVGADASRIHGDVIPMDHGHAEKITLKDIYAHMTGPIISVVFHIILIAVLGTVIIYEPPKKKDEITVEVTDVEIRPLQKPPEPPTPPDEVLDDSVPVEVDRPVLERDVVAAEVKDTSVQADAGMDFQPEAINVKVSNSSLKLGGLYAMRSGQARAQAVKQYGGSASTEGAVMRALRWLAKVQNEDGSWGDMDDTYNQQVQLTCLALLALFAHGESTGSEDFGECILKGLKRVVEWSETAHKYNGIVRNDWYAHSRVCIVLAEGYAATKIPSLKRALDMVVEPMVKRQNPIGGFHSYKNPAGEIVHTSDLDLGTRMYNALYSAFAADSSAPGILEAIDKSISAIQSIHSTSDGGFSYGMSNGKGKGDFNATAAGTLYLFLMGDGKSEQAMSGLKWLETYNPDPLKKGGELKMNWRNLPSQTSALGWYYMTQALFQAYKGKGTIWTAWNRSVTSVLLREQNHEGYWLCPADKYPSDEEKVIDGKKMRVPKIYNESSVGGFSETNAKLWATVYFTLTLEVYYQYLPTFKPQNMGKTSDGELAVGGSEDITL